ncbi:hypothetical protein [Infirmifilum uzonense]|uniref:hypothetical protein n=1 Tax=Infirmifilum uzonense TaxID=1550241 RepID=UPI000AC60248|nr:hypothetical protein [Infirmifilum uzonense]
MTEPGKPRKPFTGSLRKVERLMPVDKDRTMPCRAKPLIRSRDIREDHDVEQIS